MKIHPVRAELFHANRGRHIRDEANGPFSKILRTSLKSC